MARVFGLLERSRVPYITFNIDAGATGRRCFIGPDYVLQGRLAADVLGRVRSGVGSVAVLFSEVCSAAELNIVTCPSRSKPTTMTFAVSIRFSASSLASFRKCRHQP